MSYSKHDQTLALAGIYQAASLVKQIANRGAANNAQIDALVETLFKFDSNSVEEIYGSVGEIHHGVRVLCDSLMDRSTRDVDITKYVLSMIMLERKLTQNKSMLNKIENRLREIQSNFDLFGINHDNTYARLGQLYKETISRLGPRIIVSGERPYLGSEATASKVRALLLSGIRSAVLWRQCGGSRWHFLLSKTKYINECKVLLGRC
jgi:high frequency lysogenization protein